MDPIKSQQNAVQNSVIFIKSLNRLRHVLVAFGLCLCIT